MRLFQATTRSLDPQKVTDGLPARRCALDLLSSILDRAQPLDQALESDPTLPILSPRDRAFIRMLVTTTLRRLGQIDDLLRRASDQNAPPDSPLLHNLLRLGVTQLAFMATADYAVVDQSVELAASCGLVRQKGFVNAVLRRIAREQAVWVSTQNAARLNIPAWLFDSWCADYGDATAHAIAEASLAEAPLDLSFQNPAAIEQFAAMTETIVLPTGSVRLLRGGGIVELPGFAEGAWWVQDAAATLPAKLFGDLNDKTVIDLCAAPGGKTAQLATQGAHVIALDRSAPRLERLRENMQRLHLENQITVEVADAAVWQPRAPADFILLDAPCSATGTLRRHPDVMHLKSARDIERLAALQTRLLDHAAMMLAPGGILIYCTCSLQKSEGEQQIDAFLARHPAIHRLPIAAAEIGNLTDAITPAGDTRLLPFHLATQGGIDGFYIARLQKAA